MTKVSQDQLPGEAMTPLKAARVNVLKTPGTLKAPETPRTELKASRIATLKTHRAASNDPLLRQHVARTAARRRSVGSPRQATPPKPLRSTGEIRGPLTPPRPVRGERCFDIEIVTSRLRHVSLDDLSKRETALRSLLNCATCRTVLPFSDVFTNPDFAKLLPRDMPPTVNKVGEASYSEVFSVGEGDGAVVVKVVPLLGNSGPSSKGKATAELPDCSAVPDVVREIEITRRMSLTPGGGFVEFLG